jgi:hypothetical protein
MDRLRVFFPAIEIAKFESVFRVIELSANRVVEADRSCDFPNQPESHDPG